MWCKTYIKKAALVFVFAAVLTLGGCVVLQEQEKIQDLEYTVVKPAEIPDTLLEQIEAQKETEFELTYSDSEYLYIARGYGEQETGGFCVCIEECYLAKNTICVKYVLKRPQKGEKVNTAPSYPYAVIKTEIREENVVFE